MLGSWVRAPASSPDGNLRIVVFFCLWCNYVATDKMSIIDRMQAFSKYPFYRDMQSISTTNKNRELVGGFLLRVTSVVYSRTAYGDYGTPSVMAKAIRAL